MLKIIKSATLGILVLVSALASSQEATYRLQPQDTIRIQVYNEQQILADVPIGRDGNVSAPFVGIVKAEGKTTSELEQELVQLYITKLRIRDPKVAVLVLQFRSIRATITGMVGLPGNYPDFRPGDTIMTLIGRGGGINPDRANLRRTTLRRIGSKELIPVDLYALMQRGDTSQLYDLQDGDELNIPEDKRNFVNVWGAVTQQGPVPFRDGMTLADALGASRGAVAIRGKLSDIIVIRNLTMGGEQRIKADFVKYIRKGDMNQNILLERGDLVYVGDTKSVDPNQLGSLLNSFFFLDRIFRDGLFGLRLGR